MNLRYGRNTKDAGASSYVEMKSDDALLTWFKPILRIVHSLTRLTKFDIICRNLQTLSSQKFSK